MESMTGIRLFHTVAEHGSFSEAGRRTGLAASSVSRQIAQLEESLRTRLFNRTTRKLNLTEAGSLYYERTRNILSDLDQANLELSELQQEPSGILRLNTSIIFGRRYVAPRLPEFLSKYPRVGVEFQLTDKYVDPVEDGIDLAIRMGRPASAPVVARKLVPVHRLLVASPDYLKRKGAPRHPSDLATHNCIQFRRGPGDTLWELEKDGKTTRVQVTGNVVCDNLEAVNSVVLNGGGIAHLPTWIVGPHIESGEAVIVLPRYRTNRSGRESHFYAVYPSRHFVPSKVRAFIDFIVGKLKDERDIIRN